MTLPFVDEPGKPWVRKHDYPSEAVVGRARAYPSSLAELLLALNKAEATDDPRVRACGSHWALSRAALTDRWQIETHDPDRPVDPRHAGGGLNRMLYEIIPGCMGVGGWEFLRAQNVQPFQDADPTVFSGVPAWADKINLVCVEAGMRIWELYARLDGNMDDNLSVAAQLPNYKGPWAMPTLGGAGGQTIVGALSTGTHGGDVHIGPIADAVQAVHLIGPKGRQYWIERDLAPGLWLIDELKLNNHYRAVLGDLYREIEVIRSPETLRAAMVSVGRMGIIYSVVLRVVRQFALREWREKDTWSNVRGWITDTTNPMFSNHFLQVVVNPNGQPDDMHQHSCFISKRSDLPLSATGTMPPKGREKRGLPDLSAGKNPGFLDTSYFLNTICQDALPVRMGIGYLIALLEVIRAAAVLAAVECAAALFFAVTPPLRAAALLGLAAALVVIDWASTVISALEALQDGLADTLGEGVSQFGNWCAEHDKLEYLRKVNEMLFDGQLDPDIDETAISYAIMDTSNYVDFDCTPKGDSLEVFFEGSSNNIRDFIDFMLSVVDGLENGTTTGQRTAVYGWAALRWTHKTKALIGMQRWNRTCSIEIACPSGIHGTERFLAELEQKAIELGGVIHWGQRNNVPPRRIAESFNAHPGGDLYLWRKALSRVSRNGRDITFRTPFSFDHGLEVVQPLVQGFSRAPEWAPAGTPVTYDWNARDNPPGTTAWLEVRGPNPVAPLQLLALDGIGAVPMPAGQSELVLRVEYDFDGERRIDEQVLSVRGFQDLDTWVFDVQVISCWPVDGQSRWAAQISLNSNFISDALRVVAVRCTITNLPAVNVTKWFARTSGHPDIEFTAADDQRALAGPHPILNRDWLFFINETGCAAPAPKFRVEFTLTV